MTTAEQRAIAARLKAERERRGWGQRKMARFLRDAVDDPQKPELPSFVTYVKRWESGKVPVTDSRYRTAYAAVFGMDENELFAPDRSAPPSLWRAPALDGELGPDEEERLILAARRPVRADPVVVESLATILAAQRRTEDMIGSAALIEPVRAQLATIQELVIEARGPIRPEVVNVAAQWAQFAGWLHIATGDLESAREWLNRATDWSIEVGDLALTDSITSWKGYLAEHAGHLGPMIGMAQAAQRHRSGPGRAYDLHMEARGHALVGDRAAADRALNAACEAVAAARPADARQWEYYYFAPGFWNLERGVALRYMGRNDPARTQQAIEQLATGHAALPADMRGSEWGGVYLCHQAAAHLEAGDAESAVAVASDALAVAHATSSESLIGRVRRLHRRLADDWPGRSDVAELGEALAAGT
ncbi:helix-turn-helix domain-containing protein [Thermomonospora cellulosilytica]|uniref:Transcriptional regulator with XRE-family HTH domain n=1 Tax=Thermomonospora cellulosilytica TaxID=1411118 RepID=A0A7W3R6N8_9ACTN|nr:helix-turn-helix transcriptional regulator [Thermomonospora cellulosilytica]MBA9001741.1 transcriptional regulator with XRE-family HTH domain [Thermomonospora cellulosilytica]